MMSLADVDRRALMLARTRAHTPAAERIVATFSRFGEHGAAWVALGLAGAALDRPRRSVWLGGARTVLVAYTLNQMLKLVVRRSRPDLPGSPPLTATVSDLSFPSAHASTSFAAARAYATVGAAGPLYAAATLLALSRLYLGVHYPSDVLGGAALGTVVAVSLS